MAPVIAPEDIYEWRLQGHTAQRRGVGIDACSYPPGSAARRYWLESWQDAADDHAYFEGAEAAQAGRGFINPYAVDSSEFGDWLDGYREVREQATARLRLPEVEPET